MYVAHERRIHDVQRSSAIYLLGCGIGGNKTMIAHIRVDPETLFQEQALLFKALSDPTRLEILSLLIEANGTMNVNSLVDQIDSLAQPTVSHHLRLLIEAGLIERHRQGMYIFYQVKAARLEEAQTIIAQLLHRKRWLES